VQVNDSEVSRRHAQLNKDDAGTCSPIWAAPTQLRQRREDRRAAAEKRRPRADRPHIAPVHRLGEQSSGNLQHDVNIVGQNDVEGSRILKSVSHESGSQLFGPAGCRATPRAAPGWPAPQQPADHVSHGARRQHTLDIDQLLARIMDLIFEWVDADRGCVMLVDHETGELAPAASRSRRAAKQASEMAISRTILDYVLAQKKAC